MPVHSGSHIRTARVDPTGLSPDHDLACLSDSFFSGASTGRPACSLLGAGTPARLTTKNQVQQLSSRRYRSDRTLAEPFAGSPRQLPGALLIALDVI